MIKRTEQCKVCVQIAWLKINLFFFKLLIVAAFMLEKWRDQLSLTFDSFFYFIFYITAVISSFKLIEIKLYIDNVSEEYCMSI